MSPISKGEQHYLLFVLKVKWNKTLQSTWPKVRPVWFGPGPFYKDLDISQTGMEQREGKRVLVGWQGSPPLWNSQREPCVGVVAGCFK